MAPSAQAACSWTAGVVVLDSASTSAGTASDPSSAPSAHAPSPLHGGFRVAQRVRGTQRDWPSDFRARRAPRRRSCARVSTPGRARRPGQRLVGRSLPIATRRTRPVRRGVASPPAPSDARLRSPHTAAFHRRAVVEHASRALASRGRRGRRPVRGARRPRAFARPGSEAFRPAAAAAASR